MNKILSVLLLVVFSMLSFGHSVEAKTSAVSHEMAMRQSRIFDSNLWVYIVHKVLKANGNINPERVISFLNKNQFSLFTSEEQRVAYTLVLDKPSLLTGFMTLKNKRGDDYVPHLVGLTRFIVDENEKDKEISAREIDVKAKSHLVLLEKFMDKTPYHFRDAFYMKKYLVDISKIVNFSNLRHPRETAFAFHLGRKDGSIDWDGSSKKPKALILAGEDDPNEAFAPTKAYVKFISDIQEHYDVRYRIVSSPEEFCLEIEKAAKEGNIELLVVGGHGSPQTIRLGRDSRLLIDRKLPNEDVLKMLAPNAIIFLEACATGNGKEDAMNMANYFADRAPGRIVIAPTVPLTIFNEKLSFNPTFNVDLIDDNGRDITYKIDPVNGKPCPSEVLQMCKLK